MSQQSLTHNAVENLYKLDPRFRQIDMYAAQNGQKPTTPPGVLVLTERNSSIVHHSLSIYMLAAVYVYYYPSLPFEHSK
jgi:hypothetical protein